MFAPKVAKAQTKPAASPTDRLSTRRSLSMHRQFGNDHERGAAPENMDAREAPRGLSWDFSRISMSPPDRADRPQMSSPLRAFRPAGTIRPKLVVGRIDDPLEHEADQVADQVMRPPGPQPSLTSAPPQISRNYGSHEEEAAITPQTKWVGTAERGTAEAPGIVHEVLRSPGQALDAPTRAFFEHRFGHDLSLVRVHADPKAAAAARAVNAQAHSNGQDVAFAEGRYWAGCGVCRRSLCPEHSRRWQASGPRIGSRRTAKLANYGRPQWGFASSAGPRVRGTFFTKGGIRA